MTTTREGHNDSAAGDGLPDVMKQAAAQRTIREKRGRRPSRQVWGPGGTLTRGVNRGRSRVAGVAPS